jgi:hypothetical protein
MELERLTQEIYRNTPDNLTEREISLILAEGFVSMLSDMRATSKEMRDRE